MANENDDESFLKRHKGKIIGASVGVAAGAVAIPVGLAALGFGAGGVVAGSTAAAIQSRLLQSPTLYFYGEIRSQFIRLPYYICSNSM